MQFFNGSSVLKEQIGPGSRCFMARRTERAVEAVCLDFSCTPVGVNITLDNSTTPIACPFNQEVSSYLPVCMSVRRPVHASVAPERNPAAICAT